MHSLLLAVSNADIISRLQRQILHGLLIRDSWYMNNEWLTFEQSTRYQTRGRIEHTYDPHRSDNEFYDCKLACTTEKVMMKTKTHNKQRHWAKLHRIEKLMMWSLYIFLVKWKRPYLSQRRGGVVFNSNMNTKYCKIRNKTASSALRPSDWSTNYLFLRTNTTAITSVYACFLCLGSTGIFHTVFTAA